MTTYYNENFRLLFLSTISPNSLVGRLNAAAVIAGTTVFNNIEGVVGWGNLTILSVIGTVSALSSSYNVFFYATSFLHYLIYLSTYTYRQPHTTRIAFGAFKRDALLFKTLALTQAIVQYVTLPPTALRNQPHLPSLALLALGFGLASLAALALGVDQTYFGWELGAVKGNFVQRFPYGCARAPWSRPFGRPCSIDDFTYCLIAPLSLRSHAALLPSPSRHRRIATPRLSQTSPTP